jgi:pyrroline-5-carboxylate reductase
MSNNVLIYGAGHMGTAIVLGLMQRGYGDLQIVDPSEERRCVLSEQHNINVLTSPQSVNSEDTVILAMPPQAFAQFAEDSPLSEQHIGPVISVMAGVKISTISKLLGVSQVIRAIPNTPSEVFQGMTVFCSSKDTNEESTKKAQNIFEAFGKAVQVLDEALIDPATALCGGGPAFVAYFADAMSSFASHVGFDTSSAVLMTTQVLRGAADLIEATGKTPMQVCQEVMTPQGTTEQGICHFDKNYLKTIVQSALLKSTERSRELGALE